MTDNHPTFDMLMGSAYDRYQANNSAARAAGPDGNYWTHDQFLAQCSPAEHRAVVLGNMNQQVENGGWTQWGPHGNEYGTPATYAAIVTYLTDINTTASTAALRILEKAWKLMDQEFDGDDEDGWSDMQAGLDPLCSEYYAINDQLVNDIEAWLTAHTTQVTVWGWK